MRRITREWYGALLVAAVCHSGIAALGSWALGAPLWSHEADLRTAVAHGAPRPDGSAGSDPNRLTLNLVRIAGDVYRDGRTGNVVVTRDCAEARAVGVATLISGPAALGTRLLFSDSRACAVVGLYAPNAHLRPDRGRFRDLDTDLEVRAGPCTAEVRGGPAVVLAERVIFVEPPSACERG